MERSLLEPELEPSPEVASSRPPRAVILDVDGTLVDTNYHHTLAWQRAFADNGIEIPAWRIHQAMGMGGDQLVERVAGRVVEDRLGEQIRIDESTRFNELIFEVRPFEGAATAIEQLVEGGFRVVLASSAKAVEVDFYLHLIGADPGPHAVTNGDSVKATKPHSELFERALSEVGASSDDAVMVGDSVWDIAAAEGIGVETVALKSGGFPETELMEFGASTILESIAELPGELGLSCDA